MATIYSDSTSKVQFPLHLALINNQSEKTIQHLIKAGINVNQKDEDGKTPLHYAVKDKRSLKIIQLLLKAGANINIQDNKLNTPLNYAVKTNRNSKIIWFLLKAGADPNIQNNHYMTPLHEAIFKRMNLKTIEEILKHGFKINRKNEMQLSTILHFTLFNNKHTKLIGLIKMLLKYGADLKIRNYFGNTALLHTLCEVYGETIQIIRLFINHGAEINVCDPRGETPLHYAIVHHSHNIDVLKFLLHYSDDKLINHKNYLGQTILHEAILRLVRDNDIKDGMTRELQISINEKRRNIIELLLCHNIDTTIQDNSGKTAMEYAVSSGINSIINLLMDRATKSITI